ncbi:MAG: hypothetical protein ACLRMZ_11020 [Blautia marasmi]
MEKIHGRTPVNYFIIGMKQMGKEIFQERWKNDPNTDEDLIRRLWDNYYVPYEGLFASGKFCSDDARQEIFLHAIMAPHLLPYTSGYREIGIKAIRLITSYVILRLWRAART